MLFKGETSCEKCSHKNVCSIKELFENTKIKANDLSASILDSFEISLRCKEFREDVAVRTPFGGNK